ncbi:hypothetical protein [Mucilaginibacter aquatilis]|uniref:PBCV-specific basic adaptor domain-containing protein n=1 Tax=Mucilaginibacter aquatilis TaxID=1517760 RepID=A0A6I4IPW8_9SPHI|nr:hypothetical protein [Mucilaginibacter aquatilis]MVN90753.1 hypothetical protein [Mucilaginibacter aquatilis]
MKNVLKVALLAAGIFIAADTQAQILKKTGQAIDSGATKTGRAVGKGAKAVGKAGKKTGQKTAELAVKGKSAVVDKKYDGKVGPQGQTIYIDKNSAYYYVNKKGRHVYVRESALVTKPNN